ncbi:hypothetical protein L6452_06004 [Arctium lappa]|uniref:Uncharacterized protein n=1 Tax=Arctium lappa TaxID=4217 RepID=A0ACB9EJ11_ARCLA|nr:hypothetical protein L6452_06004 [Arctium lappa]
MLSILFSNINNESNSFCSDFKQLQISVSAKTYSAVKNTAACFAVKLRCISKLLPPSNCTKFTYLKFLASNAEDCSIIAKGGTIDEVPEAVELILTKLVVEFNSEELL